MQALFKCSGRVEIFFDFDELFKLDPYHIPFEYREEESYLIIDSESAIGHFRRFGRFKPVVSGHVRREMVELGDICKVVKGCIDRLTLTAEHGVLVLADTVQLGGKAIRFANARYLRRSRCRTH